LLAVLSLVMIVIAANDPEGRGTSQRNGEVSLDDQQTDHALGTVSGPAFDSAPRVAPRTLPSDEPAALSDLDPMPLSMRLAPDEANRSIVNKELKALEQSGAATSALTSKALLTVENLKHVSALKDAEFSEFRCFADGCAVYVTSLALRTSNQAISGSREFFSWPGPSFVSGPVQPPSGQVHTVLILWDKSAIR
jgi:hypothetical protein